MLIPEDQRQSHLSDLANFLANPWYAHFKQLAKNGMDNMAHVVMTFPVADMATANLAEQAKGKWQAFDEFSVQAEVVYAQLVTEAQETRDNPNKTNQDNDDQLPLPFAIPEP